MSGGITTELRKRRVPQVLGIYLGASWAILEFLSFAVERYRLSPNIVDLGVAALALMIPTVLLLAWQHGQPGADAWTRIEKVGIPANVLITAVVLSVMLVRVDLSRRPVVAHDRTEQPLTFSSDVFDVSLSPDGKSVAYLAKYRTGTGLDGLMFRLFVQDIAGGDPIELAEGVDSEPRWSSDGSRVITRAFHTSTVNAIPRLGGTPSFVCCRGNGTSSFDVVPGTDAMVITVWHERARRRIYVGPRTDTLRDDQIREPESSVDRTFIDMGDVVADISSVVVSPRGNWIAFLAEDTTGSFVLGTVSRDGLVRNVFAQITGLSASSRPRWAPAGDALYYFRPEGRGATLYRVAIDRRRGTPSGVPVVVEAGFPTILGWDMSRDATRLVYAGGSEKRQLRLARIETGGGMALEVDLTDDTYMYEAPTFSPEGDSIAYVKTVADGATDIYVRPRERGRERNVTTGSFDAAGVSTLNWSPDGRQLAALSLTNDSARLTIIELASGRARRAWADHLGPNNGGSSARQVPVWSPDAKRLVLSLRHHRMPLVIDIAADTAYELTLERSIGYPNDGVVSPDGRRFAEDLGVWNMDGSFAQPVEFTVENGPGQVREPVLWGSDGYIYFISRPPSEIHRVSPRDGTHERHAIMPFQCWGQLALSPDARNVVCAVSEQRSDIFVIDNFDSRVRR